MRSGVNTHWCFALLFALATVAAQALEGPIQQPIKVGGLFVGVQQITAEPLTVDGYSPARINLLTHAGDGSERLFVGEASGRILVLEPGRNPALFFDLAATIGEAFLDGENELGLNGIAFHPDFRRDGRDGWGRLYTLHSERRKAQPQSPDVQVFTVSNDTFSHWDVLTEWQASANGSGVEASSRREILRIQQPRPDRNAGYLAFNPVVSPQDAHYGLLYIGVGDGGDTRTDSGEADVDRHGQNAASVLGTILRIDPLGPVPGQYRVPSDNPFVGSDQGLPEVWAYGLGNPQRFSWDSNDGNEMLIADIGPLNIQEINLGVAGGNYGWSEREGTFASAKSNIRKANALTHADNPRRMLKPISQYDLDEGSAIAGGFVYRSDRVPELYDKYIFGDIAAGRIFYIDAYSIEQGKVLRPREMTLIQEGRAVSLRELANSSDNVGLRIGQDEQGEIYLLSSQSGHIYQLVSLLLVKEGDEDRYAYDSDMKIQTDLTNRTENLTWRWEYLLAMVPCSLLLFIAWLVHRGYIDVKPRYASASRSRSRTRSRKRRRRYRSRSEGDSRRNAFPSSGVPVRRQPTRSKSDR